MSGISSAGTKRITDVSKTPAAPQVARGRRDEKSPGDASLWRPPAFLGMDAGQIANLPQFWQVGNRPQVLSGYP
jgi:hypothetical protein